MLWRRLLVVVPMQLAYGVYVRIVTLGVVLLPVLQGKLIRPEFIFPAIPLIKQFIEAVILRMVMNQVLRLSEMFVTAGRAEVHATVITLSIEADRPLQTVLI